MKARFSVLNRAWKIAPSLIAAARGHFTTSSPKKSPVFLPAIASATHEPKKWYAIRANYRAFSAIERTGRNVQIESHFGEENRAGTMKGTASFYGCMFGLVGTG